MKTLIHLFTFFALLASGIYFRPVAAEATFFEGSCHSVLAFSEDVGSQNYKAEEKPFLIELDHLSTEWKDLHFSRSTGHSTSHHNFLTDNSNRHLLRSNRIGLPPPSYPHLA